MGALSSVSRKGEAQSWGSTIPTGSGDCAEMEVGQTRKKGRLARSQVAELNLRWRWSRAVNRLEAQALPGLGRSRGQRTGRAKAGPSPRGVRLVIQGPQGLQVRDPLISELEISLP